MKIKQQVRRMSRIFVNLTLPPFYGEGGGESRNFFLQTYFKISFVSFCVKLKRSGNRDDVRTRITSRMRDSTILDSRTWNTYENSERARGGILETRNYEECNALFLRNVRARSQTALSSSSFVSRFCHE